MRNTKIETFTDTWNPLQGCLNGCCYCYAAAYARRFGGHRDLAYYMCQEGKSETGELHVLDEPMRDEVTGEAEAYPFGFDPTFCRYRLKGASEIRRPGNIFVCSMGDLFGPWVPDQLIREVFEAASKSPCHNYIFLTKFPERYNSVPRPAENFLLGATVDTQQRLQHTLYAEAPYLRYLSVEPLQERIDLERFVMEAPCKPEWIIVGTEKGNAPGRIAAQKEWISEIVSVCSSHSIPLFMKNGPRTKSGSYYMTELMGDAFTQELHPLLQQKTKKPVAQMRTGRRYS